MFLLCILNISSLASFFGSGTLISLSSLPDLTTAGSSMSFLFVAPIILTLSKGSKPSISASSCIKVLFTSLSPLVPNSILFAAIASISSINTILGAFFLARSKISLTIFAPSPMNFCTSSEPTTSMKVEFVEDATAFASKVFPVPGWP